MLPGQPEGFLFHKRQKALPAAQPLASQAVSTMAVCTVAQRSKRHSPLQGFPPAHGWHPSGTNKDCRCQVIPYHTMVTRMARAYPHLLFSATAAAPFLGRTQSRFLFFFLGWLFVGCV